MDNILLIFFAIPLATIILSAILESFINCPIKVAGIFFSIFIVVAFALGGTSELIVAAIVYTLISLVTAIVIRLISNRNCSRRSCALSTCNAENAFTNNSLALNNLNRVSNFTLNNDLETNSFAEENNNTSFNPNNNLCRRYR